MRSVRDIFRSYAIFDSDGRHTNGTVKESYHDYGVAYEYLFRDREDVELMMEIGVADGSSLLAWREIFPNALCVGMDIHHSDKAHGDRLEFHFGDQRNLADCMAAAAGRQFALVVEDALHDQSASLMTLLYMWPYIKPGGLYVIEEFDNIGALRDNVVQLWRDGGGCGEATSVEIVDTDGPFGGVEPLVVFKRPL